MGSEMCIRDRFYLEIRTGSQVILTMFLGFGRSPLLDSKKTGRIKNELALVNQIGSDVIFASDQNFYAIFREVRRLRLSFLVFTTSKMPPRRCVVQYCSRVSDKELGISMNTSPSSGNIFTKRKRFFSQHRKNFNPTGPFGICSLHFETDGFTRAVHVKATERRIKPGSVPTIWKVTEGSISERGRRQVSKFSVLVNKAMFIQRHTQLLSSLCRSYKNFGFINSLDKTKIFVLISPTDAASQSL